MLFWLSAPKRSARATSGLVGGWGARGLWLSESRRWELVWRIEKKEAHRFAVEANRRNFARSFTIERSLRDDGRQDFSFRTSRCGMIAGHDATTNAAKENGKE